MTGITLRQVSDGREITEIPNPDERRKEKLQVRTGEFDYKLPGEGWQRSRQGNDWRGGEIWL